MRVCPSTFPTEVLPLWKPTGLARLARKREERRQIVAFSVALLLVGTPVFAIPLSWDEGSSLLAQAEASAVIDPSGALTVPSPFGEQSGSAVVPNAFEDMPNIEQTEEAEKENPAAARSPVPPVTETVDEIPTRTGSEDPFALLPDADPTGGSSRSFLRSSWQFWLYGDVRMVATDNLFIQQHNREGDLSLVLSPGIVIGRGPVSPMVRELFGFHARAEDAASTAQKSTYFYASYTPTASFFFNHPDQNALDHDVIVAGELVLSRLRVGLHARYQTLSSEELDVGTRINREISTAEATAHYLLTEKSSLEMTLHGDNVTFENGGALDNRTFSLSSFYDYKVRPKLELSAGFSAGFLQVESSPDQYFEQALVRTSWQPTGKLAFSLLTGAEWRQIDGGTDRITPVFALDLRYQPRERTTVALRAERRTFSSASLFDEDYTITSVALNFRQEFFAHMDFGLNVAYSLSDYYSTVSDPGANRSDNVIEVSPSVGINISRFSRVEFSYQLRKNESSGPNTSFLENVGRLDLKFLF